jgi:thiamine transport system permease protein
VLAIVQLVGVSGALLAYSRFQERHTASWALRSEKDLPRPVGATRALALGAVLATLGALALPLASMVSRSMGAGAYRALFTSDRVVGDPLAAVANSVVFAVVAMALATVVGLMAAAVVTGRTGRLSRWFDVTLMLPLGTSAVTIGFGFIVALGWPVDLRASFVLIPIAHALVAIPFVVRSTVPTLRSIPGDVRAAASTLGASPGRVWREIDLPIVARAAMVGAGFAFVISLGEFGATSFIARPNTVTIPVMIYRLLARPGTLSLSMAMALSVILALLTAGVVLWIDRARVGEIGSF